MRTNWTDQEDAPEAAPYEIRLHRHVATRGAAWFDEMALTYEADGTTLLTGQVATGSAARLLHKVRATGLPLISVTALDPRPSGPRTSARDAHRSADRPGDHNHDTNAATKETDRHDQSPRAPKQL
jgi:hypothetical protein